MKLRSIFLICIALMPLVCMGQNDTISWSELKKLGVTPDGLQVEAIDAGTVLAGKTSERNIRVTWKGKFVTGLADCPEEKMIFKKLACKRYTVKEVNEKTTIEEYVPMSLLFLVDQSGSISEDIEEEIREALKKFLQVKRPLDRISIVFFADQKATLVPFTTETDTILDRLESVSIPDIGSGSLISEMLNDAVQEMKYCPENSIRMIVLLSDCDDSGENRTPDLMDKMIFDCMSGSSPIHIYTLGYNLANDDRPWYQSVSEKTGGAFYEQKSARDLDTMLSLFRMDISRYYKVTCYEPRDAIRGEIQFPDLASSGKQTVAFFEQNSFSLDNQYENALVEIAPSLAEALLNDASLNITIQGFSSAEGPEDYNDTLSEKRAQAVATFLWSNLKPLGIKPNRINIQAEGEYKAAHPADADESLRKNDRRVDLILHRAY